MRNTWKGLVIGSLTGAAVGLVLDGLGRASDTAATVTEHARDHLRDSDLPQRASALVQRVAESDTADRARQAASSAADSARDAARKRSS